MGKGYLENFLKKMKKLERFMKYITQNIQIKKKKYLVTKKFFLIGIII